MWPDLGERHRNFMLRPGSEVEKVTDNCFRCRHPATVGEMKPEVLERDKRLLGVIGCGSS